MNLGVERSVVQRCAKDIIRTKSVTSFFLTREVRLSFPFSSMDCSVCC